VWSSTDGRTWIQVTASAEFLPRKDAGGTFWQGQLWMIGPRDSDVWSSSTGEHWSKNSVAAVIPSKWLATAIGFKDRLWVLDEELQFWSTADGRDWVKEVPRLSGFSPILGVSGAQLFVFENRLVLVGGLQYSAPDYFREVWSSEDGRNWSKILDATPFRADGFSQVIVGEDKLLAYTIGQTPGGSLIMEIWSSTDAINWNRVTDTAAFVPNAGPRVIAYNGKFWAIGGRSAMEEHRDVWSSLDGVNWTQVNSTGLPPVTAIGFRAGLVFSDKLCLYGPIATYEAWCSADGRAWERRSTDVPAGVFGSLNGVAFAIGPSEKRYGSMDLVWKSTDGVSWRQGYRNTLQFD
jgi:hypothetical protein